MILLLHGAAFTSQTWVDKVETLVTLAALGNRLVKAKTSREIVILLSE